MSAWHEAGRSALPPPRPVAQHADEGQVALDVRRSFHAWDAALVGDVHLRQAQLSDLLCGTLRAYPYLHYYQGLHDIVAVILLTMCPTPTWPSDAVRERVQTVVHYVCLMLVRDDMTTDLLPAMAQMKLVLHIVRAADAPYAYALERTFGSSHIVVVLPWLLTLLTHDAPSLAVAQHVVTFVLEHGPASMLYVCAALVLAQKEEALHVVDDMPLLHQHLAQAPRTHMTSGAQPILTAAASLMQTYSLECPVVCAHRVLSRDSVLFTWPRTDVDVAHILSLPTSHLVLDAAPTPREHPRVAVAPRLRPMRRLLRCWRGPPTLWVSSLSLLLGGSVLSLLLAMHVASAPYART